MDLTEPLVYAKEAKETLRRLLKKVA